jgi:hypothetical protein
MTRIQPGQEYETCQPTYYGSRGEEHTRIRVVGKPNVTVGAYGFGKVFVVTVTADGRELRRRLIDMIQLHATGVTGSGQPRKNGYRLVKDAGVTP